LSHACPACSTVCTSLDDIKKPCRRVFRRDGRTSGLRQDYDYKVNEKVLIAKDGILRKTESRYDTVPWTIMTVHTNGTITVRRGNKSQRINIRRVTPFYEENE
jgi:hypothetical protein